MHLFNRARYNVLDVTPTQATTAQMESSSTLLSAGAPSFGAGASFETLDFSLPSYNQAVSGDVSSKEAAPAKEDDAAAKAAERAAEQKAKEEAKIAAAEKKEGKEVPYYEYSIVLS